jgi:enamine deaminase RidA (YjgF/YER057c/UK114 family)
MTKQLDQQQLLDIARTMANDPNEKMPDYLTRQEEETVKELVKTLRASQLAMKTYVQKTTYLDSYKAQLDRQRLVFQAVADRDRAYATHWNQYQQMRRVQAGVERQYSKLSSDATLSAWTLEQDIDDAVRDIADTLIRHGILPPDRRDVIKDTMAVLESGLYLKKSNDPDGESAYKLGFERFGAIADKVKTAAPHVANAFKQHVRRWGEAVADLNRSYGIVSLDSRERLTRMVDDLGRTAHQSAAAVDVARNEYNESVKLTETHRRLTLTMSKWYIVAAMGDALAELGQNLAY